MVRAEPLPSQKLKHCPGVEPLVAQLLHRAARCTQGRRTAARAESKPAPLPHRPLLLPPTELDSASLPFGEPRSHPAFPRSMHPAALMMYALDGALLVLQGSMLCSDDCLAPPTPSAAWLCCVGESQHRSAVIHLSTVRAWHTASAVRQNCSASTSSAAAPSDSSASGIRRDGPCHARTRRAIAAQRGRS